MTEPTPQPAPPQFDRMTAFLHEHANVAAQHAVEAMQLRVRVAELEAELKAVKGEQ